MGWLTGENMLGVLLLLGNVSWTKHSRLRPGVNSGPTGRNMTFVAVSMTHGVNMRALLIRKCSFRLSWHNRGQWSILVHAGKSRRSEFDQWKCAHCHDDSSYNETVRTLWLSTNNFRRFLTSYLCAWYAHCLPDSTRKTKSFWKQSWTGSQHSRFDPNAAVHVIELLRMAFTLVTTYISTRGIASHYLGKRSTSTQTSCYLD